MNTYHRLIGLAGVIFSVAIGVSLSQGASAQLIRGSVLVAQLPDGVEGVEIRGDAVRVKAGYEFVEIKSTNSFAVRRIGAGLGAGGSWSCNCAAGKGGGACDGVISGGTLTCVIPAGSNCTECDLTVTTGIQATAIMRYQH